MKSENFIMPCPFCGNIAVKTAKGVMQTTMILCDKCGATVSFWHKEREQQAINAWNKRWKAWTDKEQ